MRIMETELRWTKQLICWTSTLQQSQRVEHKIERVFRIKHIQIYSSMLRVLVCSILLRVDDAKCQTVQSVRLPTASTWTDFLELLQVSGVGPAICDPLGVVGTVHIFAAEATETLLGTLDGLARLSHVVIILAAVRIASKHLKALHNHNISHIRMTSW